MNLGRRSRYVPEPGPELGSLATALAAPSFRRGAASRCKVNPARKWPLPFSGPLRPGWFTAFWKGGRGGGAAQSWVLWPEVTNSLNIRFLLERAGHPRAILPLCDSGRDCSGRRPLRGWEILEVGVWLHSACGRVRMRGWYLLTELRPCPWPCPWA